MTSREFILKIRKIYLNARKTMFSSTNSVLIRRITSHTVASQVEDLFAKYCSAKLSNNAKYQILIDPQITFLTAKLRNKTGRKKMLIRPDVCVLRKLKGEWTAVAFFNVKMDLGLQRGGKKIILEENNRIEKILSREAKTNDGESKDAKDAILFKISKSLKSHFVLVSDKNISQKEIRKIMTIKRPNVMLHILTGGRHLNDYISSEEELMSSLKINRKYFEGIDRILKAL